MCDSCTVNIHHNNSFLFTHQVFQKRFKMDVDFNRNWIEYKQGFGDINGDFWLGEILSLVWIIKSFSNSALCK